MTLLFCDSFDAYTQTSDLTIKWAGPQISAAYATGAGKFGGGAASIGTGAQGLQTGNIGLSASNTLMFAAYVKSNYLPQAAPNSNGGLTNQMFFLPTAFSSIGGILAPNPATGYLSALKVGASTTVLATGTHNICDGNYHWIEAQLVLSTTVGSFKVYVDGILDINFSGATLSATTLNGNACFGCIGPSGSSTWYDDVIVWDNTGSSFNTFPLGPRRIACLNPSGAGASTQFTPSAGANYACVAQAYSGSANVSNAGTGNTDLYATGGLAYTPASVINAVVVNTYAANPAGDGTKNLTAKLRSGATPSVASGATRMLPATLTNYQDAFYADASGTAWAYTSVNAAQPGVGD